MCKEFVNKEFHLFANLQLLHHCQLIPILNEISLRGWPLCVRVFEDAGDDSECSN